MADRVDVGIVGCGGIFQWAHLQKGYVYIPEARITALVDVNEKTLADAERTLKKAYEKRIAELKEAGDTDTAALFADDLKRIRTYNDMAKMLDEAEPAAVDVCTMPDSHMPIAVKALNAGCHVMCEKPMARTWIDTLPLLDAVRKSGKHFQQNENWIWQPGWYSMRKVVDGGMIGDVIAAYLSAAHGGPEGKAAFWDPFKQGGGAMPDMAIHALTTAWFVVGFEKKPVAIQAAAPVGVARRFRKRIVAGGFRDIEAEDDSHFMVRYEDPDSLRWATTMIEGSWSYRDAPDTMVVGSAGTAAFGKDEEGHEYIEVKGANDSRRIPVSGPTWEEYPAGGYYGEIRDFVRGVREGRAPMVDAGVGSEAQAVVGAAFMSQANGMRPVEMREFKDHARQLMEEHGDKASDVLIEEGLLGLR
ncbi:MAG: Gfo/Idh/MocA family oxidoreductase [Planctomycetes bacterium]|nr:Gfo/Idh/MocA family oxidoreductase [Planctomycetota bacterium]